jgi:tetratricopeptide (TPR) repeat protein
VFARVGTRRSWFEVFAIVFAALVLTELSSALRGPSTNFRVVAQLGSPELNSSKSGTKLKRIIVDYPEEESVFPPDMAPPTFLWRDTAEEAMAWQIDIVFADGSTAVHTTSRGELFQIGEIDEHCVAPSNERPTLTPQLAATRTWIPDDETWRSLKRHATGIPVTITFTGFRESHPVSHGKITIQISKDPVGAPIFYRDVPLMPTEGDKNAIKPLDPDAVPLIAWRLRYVGETRSHLLLTGMHTCANCHSFSNDGKTLGMDMDGPGNDKGLYALAPVQPQMTIRREDLISWNGDWQLGLTRVGFMSQVSPDGQYVLTTFTGPGLDLRGSYYLSNFKDYRFLQVFYPTRGILSWYSRIKGERRPLPGADDLDYVQTDGVWSPDGSYIVFARAKEKEPYRMFQIPAKYANDPNETQIKYDLYRIPFNGGKGGSAVPITGASGNGMSNNFPKVSPDGRWIVFVQCRNGQLMRPDSQLFIIPANGGVARRMRCNTRLMNSWHSFSPNGHWLVFSSKSRSPYTQMFLTHIDANGHDSPAILIENATAANRAVNIPEFVNIPEGGLLKINAPAAESFEIADHAAQLTRKGQLAEALAEWKRAVETDPEDEGARNGLALSLAKNGNYEEAVKNFRKATELNPKFVDAYVNWGELLYQLGKRDEAIAQWQRAVEVSPDYAKVQFRLGDAYYQMGRIREALAYWRKGISTDPNHLPILNQVAWLLATSPDSSIRNGAEAVSYAEKAVRMAGGDRAELLDTLAAAYAEAGRFSSATAVARRALVLAAQESNQELTEGLKTRTALYEAGTPFRDYSQITTLRMRLPD